MGYGPDDNFTDIRATGTLSTATGDDAQETVTLPFTFSYYGRPVTAVSVTTNGQINLGSSLAYWFTGMSSLPSASLPMGIIAPFWGDLAATAASPVYYATRGTAPNREFVVEWYRVPFLGDPTSSLTFQVVLHEDGRIDYLYGGMLHGALSAAASTGGLAEVGQQNYDRDIGFTIGNANPGTVLSGSGFTVGSHHRSSSSRSSR